MSSRTFCSTAVSEHNSLQMIALCIYLLLLGLCLSGGKGLGSNGKKKKKKTFGGESIEAQQNFMCNSAFSRMLLANLSYTRTLS